ncbi:hypothetical protein BM526_16750 [Alteromonas mediterranea]|nr:hypothetical protein BM526_16750 [Alteromonas mediterranea]
MDFIPYTSLCCWKARIALAQIFVMLCRHILGFYPIATLTLLHLEVSKVLTLNVLPSRHWLSSDGIKQGLTFSN